MRQVQLLGGALLLLVLSTIQIEANVPEGRILGGGDAPATDISFAGSLRIDNNHVCGCTILSETKLITAAHCQYRNGKKIEAKRMSVRVGSTNQSAGGKIVSVAAFTVHPDYFDLEHNVAIITLSAPLVWTERIRPIELVDKDAELPQEGEPIKVFGWGTTVDGTHSFKIRELSLTFAADAVCQDAYQAHNINNSFCLAHALKEGTCYGDGGGCAIHNGKVMGISNFVIGACGSRYPDVFVRTSAYYDWVQEQLSQ